MYCEECQKRPANVHFTKIINGKKIQMHLCEQCARKQQEQIGFTFIPDFSFPSFLTSILAADPFSSLGGAKEENINCEKCGMTYSQFMNTGRMGCNKCYEVFRVNLENLLKRVHGITKHTGKIPKRAGIDIRLRQELTEARMELQKAVLNEEYEQAAKLRDKIKELEKKKEIRGGGAK